MLQELTARIRALLRRGSSSPPVLEWGFSLNSSTRDTTKSNLCRLTPKEHRLLELSLRRGCCVFSQCDSENLWSFEEPPGGGYG